MGCSLGVFGALSIALSGLAIWAESKGHAHPYDLGGEVLRFLLPSFTGQPGANRIMLLGASSVQEGLLYEEFERAFPVNRASCLTLKRKNGRAR